MIISKRRVSKNILPVLRRCGVAFGALVASASSAYAQVTAPSSYNVNPADRIQEIGTSAVDTIAVAVTVIAAVVATGFFAAAAAGKIKWNLFWGVLVGGGGVSSVAWIVSLIVGG